MVKLLYWIKTNFALKKITEIDTASRLEEFREKQAVYKGPSFKSITAYGAHSAVVHYSPTLDTNIQLKEGGLFLIDAGAHYLDGTTDITRTIALGVPSKEQKYFFTCVLKANIALTSTQFPTNTKGIQLDAIARKVLWDVGADYGHGSGHGVGSYLCVHEGPQRLSYIPPGSDYPLQQGMFVSIEPGFYKEGEYGIRIENLAVIIKNPATNFLCFDIVTLCPIDLSLVELHLLNKSEINFINQYHEKVYLILKDYLDNKEKRWLRDSTLPIL